jgi:hypothetical protein
MCLSERVGQELDFDLRTDALVQYIIYSIENRHVDVHVAIDFLHTLGAEISFCNHLGATAPSARSAFAAHPTKKGTARKQTPKKTSFFSFPINQPNNTYIKTSLKISLTVG